MASTGKISWVDPRDLGFLNPPPPPQQGMGEHLVSIYTIPWEKKNAIRAAEQQIILGKWRKQELDLIFPNVFSFIKEKEKKKQIISLILLPWEPSAYIFVAYFSSWDNITHWSIL